MMFRKLTILTALSLLMLPALYAEESKSLTVSFPLSGIDFVNVSFIGEESVASVVDYFDDGLVLISEVDYSSLVSSAL